MSASYSGQELWCDQEFCGNWKVDVAHLDRLTAKSRTGVVISYAECPVTWSSRMQGETASTTTKAEFNALSEGPRMTISLWSLFEEVSQQGVSMINSVGTVYCSILKTIQAHAQ